jgi:hypothetical protein
MTISDNNKTDYGTDETLIHTCVYEETLEKLVNMMPHIFYETYYDYLRNSDFQYNHWSGLSKPWKIIINKTKEFGPISIDESDQFKYELTINKNNISLDEFLSEYAYRMTEYLTDTIMVKFDELIKHVRDGGNIDTYKHKYLKYKKKNISLKNRVY